MLSTIIIFYNKYNLILLVNNLFNQEIIIFCYL